MSVEHLWSSTAGKVKVKFALQQAIKTLKGRRGIALLLL
jgi:hypothetical protein